MKGQHRKELQTNVLADQMGKLLHRTKSSSNLLWLLALLIVGLVVTWWWWTSRTADAYSAAWAEYYRERQSADGARSVARRHEGTAAGRAAELTYADQVFEDAYQIFFRSPERAREQFREAASIYQKLADNSGKSHDIAARALLGQAKCHEWLGDLEMAKFYYDELGRRYVSHPLATEAQKKKELLADAKTAAFYKDWPKRLPAVTAAGLPKSEP